MSIRALDIAIFATAAARPPARIASPAGGSGPSWQISGRYAAALQVLGIDNVISAKAPAPSAAIGRGGDGHVGPGKLASYFRQELGTAKSAFPGISDANARHIAQYETIVANRSEFPPGEFYIHTELGDGASITTQVPATAQPAVSVATVSINAISATFATATGHASLSVVSAQAFYAEWS